MTQKPQITDARKIISTQAELDELIAYYENQELQIAFDQQRRSESANLARRRLAGTQALARVEKITSGDPDPATKARAEQIIANRRHIESWCSAFLANESSFAVADYVTPFLPENAPPSLSDRLLNEGGRYWHDFIYDVDRQTIGLTVDPCRNAPGEPPLSPWNESHEEAPIAIVTARKVYSDIKPGGRFALRVDSDQLQRHIIRGTYTLDSVVDRIASGKIPTSCDLRLQRSCGLSTRDYLNTVAIARGDFVVFLRVCYPCIRKFHAIYEIGACGTDQLPTPIG